MFPVLRCVEPGYHYKIPVNDTSLPQNDPFPAQREKELQIAKEKYQFKEIGLNLPLRVKNSFQIHLIEYQNRKMGLFNEVTGLFLISQTADKYAYCAYRNGYILAIEHTELHMLPTIQYLLLGCLD